ncbi:hypothetical protein [Vibrio hepatarius]|uniref:hypothetical protein n=1 Tax=Vibrio hepatarius TaxID=171383 RepID=UPI001C0A0484|nr:hypothetical protein [Vibrio hepatarius]MBU2898359.1 hypothetical protein [Vibrio hepatarius]
MERIRINDLLTSNFAIKLYAIFWVSYIVCFSVVLCIYYLSEKEESLAVLIKWGSGIGLFGFFIYVASSYFIFSRKMIVAAMRITKNRAESRSI